MSEYLPSENVITERDALVERVKELEQRLSEVKTFTDIDRAETAEAERDALRKRVRMLEEKLQRVLDWLRYQANSEGGLAHEVEALLDFMAHAYPGRRGRE